MLSLKHIHAVENRGGIREHFPSSAGADKRSHLRVHGGEELSEVSGGSRRELRQLRETRL